MKYFEKPTTILVVVQRRLYRSACALEFRSRLGRLMWWEFCRVQTQTWPGRSSIPLLCCYTLVIDPSCLDGRIHASALITINMYIATWRQGCRGWLDRVALLACVGVAAWLGRSQSPRMMWKIGQFLRSWAPMIASIRELFRDASSPTFRRSGSLLLIGGLTGSW